VTTQTSTHADPKVTVLKNYVGGHWVTPRSDRQLDVVNPATQSVLARVPLSDRDDLEHAVSAARAAFPAWRSRSTIERARWLFSLREALVDAREELARLVVSPRWARRWRTLAPRSAG
jgi:malonate-semialdehyde dehydrogenase (acetylating)/methylmalonate-semialdehyde dehydrogenase